MVFEKSKEALLSSLEEDGIYVNGLEGKSVGDIYRYVWRNHSEKFKKIVEKHVDNFFGDINFEGNLDEILNEYHNPLNGKYFNVKIKNHERYITINVNDCPYRSSCEAGSPCIRKIAIEYLLSKNGYNLIVESEKNPCVLVIHNEIRRYLDKIIDEVKKLSNDLTFEKILEYSMEI